MSDIRIWTDGSCRNATNDKGGYGFVIVNGSVRQYCGGSYYNTTNSRQELRAIVQALKKCEPGPKIIIHSDSQYCVHAYEKGWVFNWQKHKFSGKKNSDLWEEFLVQFTRHKGNIKMKWVRGHNGDIYNEVADELARIGAHRKLQIRDSK